ncbi:MAG: SufE family protein [Alphaproteobacteria bacterium]|nr:SufE family protein [Alphaproteobacteria bacterium]MCY4230212.1 SufE family protein [Alphaproteobacteria bacterium]MCY4317609.1 SufE family protein [Alphaproteobacteria bacterium]
MGVPLQARPAPTETMADAQRSIVDSFRYLEDWTERYQYIIELGRRLPPFPETKRIEANRMHGCQAGVWLVSDYRDGKLFFEATSDSAIVAGLISLLLKVYSGRRPDEILATTPAFIEEIGLAEHLSPHRANGLALMLARIQADSSGYQAGEVA